VHAGEWNIAPNAPALTARKVFLTDAHAIGYAESIVEIVQALKLGDVVGSPTAGTNGTLNRFQLPGDYTVLFTGTKVMKHDGNPFHGAGITPDILVTPTRDSLAAGHDEVLDRALQLLTAAPSPTP
jgi:C-terminal processing protease CtpA/Prc